MTGLSGLTRAWLAGVLLALSLLATAACAGEDEDQPGFALVTSSAEPSTPEPTPTPIPEQVKELFPLDKRMDGPRTAVKDAGRISAEPYRVHTGDGDCLNVRPSPGTTFATDPRTCVPEGFLLWLYGEPMEVDGLTWRYALGEGWVATQYVKADPASANILESRIPTFTVVVYDGVEQHFSSVAPDGKVTKLTSLPIVGSTSLLQASKNGPAMAATQIWGSDPYVVLTELQSGKQERVDATRMLGWGDDGTLLVLKTDLRGEHIAAVKPFGATTILGEHVSNMGSFNLSVGAKSVFATAEGSAIFEFPLSGSGPIQRLARSDGRPYFGEVSVSPDGSRLLSSPYLGPIQLLTLANGALSEFPRAPQQTNVGGRCGGASGRLSTWLDNDTIAWHESYAQKGYNGITIGDLKTNTRKLVPFFTLQNLWTVDAKTLTFTTTEYIEQESFTVTWILDIVSGEARPVTYGSTTPSNGLK